MPDARFHLNPAARHSSPALLTTAAERRLVREYFDRVEARPTPLHRFDDLAARLGVAELLVKDESARFGLPAFKILGVSFAVDRLVALGRIGAGATIVSATAGNHGRAVARAARDRGLVARIYVPAGTASARREAIADEGAHVIVVDGTYEDAVTRAAADAERHGWVVVSDTSWPGYDEIPRWIMAGYTRLLDEAASQWAPAPRPDVVVVQAGVGGLACAVAGWLAERHPAKRPFLIVAEPQTAACVLESIRAGRPTTVAGSLDTEMAGLRCAEISPVTWRVLAGTVDACIAVTEDQAADAMRRLRFPIGDDPSIAAGASGACGVAALVALTTQPALEPVRVACQLSPSSRVMAICTEGATDPSHYTRVVGSPDAGGEPGLEGAPPARGGDGRPEPID